MPRVSEAKSGTAACRAFDTLVGHLTSAAEPFNVDYLNRIWVEGQRFSMRLEVTEAEKKVAAAGALTETRGYRQEASRM